MKQLLTKKIIYLSSALFLLFLLAVFFFVFYNASKTEEDPQPIEPVIYYNSMKDYIKTLYTDVRGAGMADYYQYTYEELLERAQVIAVVTPLDELATDNSFGITEKGDRFYAAHSLREVKAVEVIKGDIAANESFQMAEKCVLLEDGTLVMHEDCYPMQKGDYYLVFLSPSRYPGRPLLAHSADNGKCDLSNLYLNSDWRKQLFAEACADIWPGKQSALSEIEGFTKAEIRSESELVPGDTWESIMVTTPYTEQGKEIIIEICQKDNQTIYRIGDCYYIK